MSMKWSQSSAQEACPDDVPELMPLDALPTTPRATGCAVSDPAPCSAPQKPPVVKKRRLSLSLAKGAGAGAGAPAPGSMAARGDAVDTEDDSVHDNDMSFSQVSVADSVDAQASSTTGVFSCMGEDTSPLPAARIIGSSAVAAGGAASGSLFSQESIVQFPSPSQALSPMYLSVNSRMSTDGSAGGSQEQRTDVSMATFMTPPRSSSPTSLALLPPALAPELLQPIVQPISVVRVLSPGENVPLTTPTWPTFGPGVHERVQRTAVHMQQRCILGL